MSNTTRPEAVQEAMQMAEELSALEPEEITSSARDFVALAAYVRELEAERDRLRDERDLNLNLLMVERNLNKELRSELAEVRKGRG